MSSSNQLEKMNAKEEEFAEDRFIEPSSSFLVVSNLLDDLEKSFKIFEQHFNYIKEYYLKIDSLNDKDYLKSGIATKDSVEGLCKQIEEINMHISKLEDQKASNNLESKEKLFELFKFVNIKIKPRQKEIETLLKDIIVKEKKRNESLEIALDNVAVQTDKFSPEVQNLDEPLISQNDIRVNNPTFSADDRKQLLLTRREETEKINKANQALIIQIRQLALIEEKEENEHDIADAKRRLSLISNTDPNERKKRFLVVFCILLAMILIISLIVVVLHMTH